MTRECTAWILDAIDEGLLDAWARGAIATIERVRLRDIL